MTDTQHEPTPFAGHERDPLDELFDAVDDPRVDAVLHAVGTRLAEAPDELTARRHLKAIRRAAPSRPATPIVRRLVLRTAAATGAAAALTLVLALTGSLPAPAQQLASDTAERFGIQLPGPRITTAEAPTEVELPEEVPDHARIPERVPVPGGKGRPEERPAPRSDDQPPRGLGEARQRTRGPIPEGELPPWVPERRDDVDRAPSRPPHEAGGVDPAGSAPPADARGPSAGGTAGEASRGAPHRSSEGATNGADNARSPEPPSPVGNGGR